MNQLLKALGLSLAVVVSSQTEAALPDVEAGRMADAIWQVEGGPRTAFPYGIRSIKTTSAAHARRICINTIQNNHGRWLRAGRPGAFVDFLADRYCPKAADPRGNANWKRNMRRKGWTT